MITRCIKCNKPLVIGSNCVCNGENIWGTKKDKRRKKTEEKIQ